MALDRDLQQQFLQAFKVQGTVSKASKAANVARQSHYRWMATDVAYSAEFKALRYTICQQIDDSLTDRLANGWDEPVYQGGKLVGHKRKYDNAAAIAYLDRHDPDFIKGKRQNVDLTSSGAAVPAVQFFMPSNGRNPDG